MYRKRLSRRTFLRGAGAVAIALPFLDEMTTSSAYATPPTTLRCFTLFFAHGVPIQVLRNGLTGPLAPLARIQHRLGIYGGVDLHTDSGNGHETGGMSVFCGTQRRSSSASGGASIEQVIRAESGAAPTALPFFNMASYFRRGEVFRHIHSWADDGSPTQVPVDQPAEVFRSLFGARSEPTDGDDAARRWQRYRTSVLDTVLDEYRHLTSDAGQLSAPSRERVREHLDRLRELELRLRAPIDDACPVPESVTSTPPLWNEDQSSPPNKPTIVPRRWVEHWELMTDLYALGAHCDLFRFGHVGFQGAAERALMRGPYEYDGRGIEFADTTDHHEAWHAYSGGAVPEDRMAWHLHFILDQSVRFLEKLDDPAYPTESGRTLLDDSLVVMGTELGDGSRHSTTDVFHAVSSAGGRLRVGVIDDQPIPQVDLLNTCLSGLSIERRMGDLTHSRGLVDRMLVS